MELRAVITTVAIQKSTLIIEIPFMIIVTVILLFMGMTGESVTLFEGIILWVIFLAYLSYLFILARKGKQEKSTDERSVLKLIVLTVLGGIIVVWGSDITVDSATAIAKFAGLSERFIGLTIVAIGEHHFLSW